MYELKTNTAYRMAVGPLVDPTDGKTAETALTVTGMTCDILQIKTDGTAVVRTSFAPTASGGNNDMVHVTDDAVGMYDLELTAAQINFLGNARLVFYDVDGFLVHWIDIQVVSAAYFDWKYGTNLPNVNVTQISGDSAAADNAEAFFDGTGYVVTGYPEQTGDAYAILNSDTYGNSALKSLIDDVTDYVEGIDAVTNKIDTTMELDGSVYRFTENSLELGPLNSEGATTATIAAAVWDSLRTAITTAGSIGKALSDWFDNAPPSLPPATPSDVVICNNALALLGNTSITTLTGDTKASKLCAQFYHQVVNATLRAYTWNCATVRSAALTATTTPTFGFSCAFTLPTDCLRVLMIEDDPTISFKVENNVLLTDESTCKISYIKKIDVGDADGLLIEAISARLAATIAFALTNSTSAAEAMWKLYKDKLDEAQSVDAFEGTAPQMASDDWINSRS